MERKMARRASYDVLVVGGGPGGATAAIYAARAGLKVGLIDKASFPRDKTCGDALLFPALEILNDLQLMGALERLPHTKSQTFRISSENRALFLEMPYNVYISRRLDFDHLLFRAAQAHGVDTYEKCRALSLRWDDDRVVGVHTEEQDFDAAIIIGADGASSVIAHETKNTVRSHEQWSAATRCYYRGVKFNTPTPNLEFFFLDRCAPGYFWVFPMPDGGANAGVGCLRSSLKLGKGNIRAIHKELIRHPLIEEMFANATAEDNIQGWQLPMGNVGRQLHGAGYMLCGDAAGLVNPLWGDGIHIAMTSGVAAAEMSSKAIARNDISAASLKSYTDHIWKVHGALFDFEKEWRTKFANASKFDPSVDRLDLMGHYLKRWGADHGKIDLLWRWCP
jgi:geranylgeranyl reductase family protein